MAKTKWNLTYGTPCMYVFSLFSAFSYSRCSLHHVAHVLADVVRHVGAVHVVPEEVPGPGEQRVVELQHGHAVLALN